MKHYSDNLPKTPKQLDLGMEDKFIEKEVPSPKMAQLQRKIEVIS